MRRGVRAAAAIQVAVWSGRAADAEDSGSPFGVTALATMITQTCESRTVSLVAAASGVSTNANDR